ncbi:MAG: DNA-3-methyladenine glycosylase 2 family protein [Bauldia sp.]|nr:DNA-3-methyladenine glycosylase 2 family protein [Bauldia sp.]
MTRTLDTEADIAEGLRHLARADRRLKPVIKAAGAVAVRRQPAGFEGLAKIVVSQQLSAASANAIWRKVAVALPAVTPDAIAAADDATLRGAGLSAGKTRTLRAVSAAVLDGLDLAHLAERPAEEAIAALTAISGIGPWTADIYLLFSLGHADVFPAGDLALRVAVAGAFGLDPMPSSKALAEIAAAWSPWRGVAAILFWAYYPTLRARKSA